MDQLPNTAREALAPARDPFDRYLSELQALPLLDADQEIALAREIEAAVIAHWQVLIAHRPAFAVSSAAVGRALGTQGERALSRLRRLSRGAKERRRGGQRSRSGRRRWADEVAAAAGRLRQLDSDGAALTAADRAVRDAFASDQHAGAYLSRLARARAAQRGAKARFVSANLRLVIMVARRHDRGLMPLADLIQEGNLGLMRAVERFDWRRGFRFSTYGTWWIRHHVNRALSDKARLVRVPVHTLDDISRVARVVDACRSKTGAAPSPVQLAAETGISAERLEELDVHARVAQPLSLDRNLGDDHEQTLHDLLSHPEQPDPDRGIDLDAWRALLERLLSGLSPIEAATLRLRFGLGGGEELKLREIGVQFDLSRERIRQIQEEALQKLRSALTPCARDLAA